MFFYFFISLFSIFFKWSRFIFILISFEFFILGIFYYFSFFFSPLIFFYFICFSVVSSVSGIVVLVYMLKFYGSDCCVF
uniref:NADH dehydrogenase subunit 4L n=1 Tax=Strongyloides ratti TaxID=34506 RepID=A0A0S3M467_STRRB|nr:NADH dehydrogenase subunit 4L [Strongyloides ratti]BAT21195.1 NADH dehydrogenase subunit 4L [Strongyloides ratti]